MFAFDITISIFFAKIFDLVEIQAKKVRKSKHLFLKQPIKQKVQIPLTKSCKFVKMNAPPDGSSHQKHKHRREIIHGNVEPVQRSAPRTTQASISVITSQLITAHVERTITPSKMRRRKRHSENPGSTGNSVIQSSPNNSGNASVKRNGQNTEKVHLKRDAAFVQVGSPADGLKALKRRRKTLSAKSQSNNDLYELANGRKKRKSADGNGTNEQSRREAAENEHNTKERNDKHKKKLERKHGVPFRASSQQVHRNNGNDLIELPPVSHKRHIPINSSDDNVGNSRIIPQMEQIANAFQLEQNDPQKVQQNSINQMHSLPEMKTNRPFIPLPGIKQNQSDQQIQQSSPFQQLLQNPTDQKVLQNSQNQITNQNKEVDPNVNNISQKTSPNQQILQNASNQSIQQNNTANLIPQNQIVHLENQNNLQQKNIITEVQESDPHISINQNEQNIENDNSLSIKENLSNHPQQKIQKASENEDNQNKIEDNNEKLTNEKNDSARNENTIADFPIVLTTPEYLSANESDSTDPGVPIMLSEGSSNELDSDGFNLEGDQFLKLLEESSEPSEGLLKKGPVPAWNNSYMNTLNSNSETS